MANLILAIDPGPEQSGWVLYDPDEKRVVEKGRESNRLLEAGLAASAFSHATDCVIEMVANYGQVVGKDVFETCVQIGTFLTLWELAAEKPAHRLYRRDVKLYLCNSAAAKDKNVRQALIDKFGGDQKAIGGKRCPKCKGKGWFGRNRPVCPRCDGAKWKHPPGPLYGVAEDEWAALGVAVCWSERPDGGKEDV